MNNVLKLYAEKLETLPDAEVAITQASAAMTYGLTVSAMSQMTDSKPVLLFTRQNILTGEVECIHPDAPEPIFEPAVDVFSRMIKEAKSAKVRPGTIH